MTDSVYRERAHLVANLAAQYPSHIHETGEDDGDWPLVTVETPQGQMCWHIARGDMELFGHVRATTSDDRSWDGHSTEEKYERLHQMTMQRARTS